MKHRSVSMDVVSDVVCPWCFLGWARLSEALAMAKDVPVKVSWRPFQLDPTIPPGGIPREKYLRRKFGDLATVKASHQRLTALGSASGIDFAFDRITIAPNTLDAHRLLLWAGEEGVQGEMVERLFRLYFEEGADVGSTEVLCAAAQEVGLDGSEIARRLATDRDRAAVKAEIAMWQQAGVTGVPCFVFNRRYAVVGAQEAEILVEAIRRVAEEKATPEGAVG